MTSSSRPSEQVWPTRVNSALQDAASDRPVDAQTLLEDLRIHQVELEMQAQALRASEARAQAESLRLQHLLAEVPVALVRIDGLGRTVAINRAAESLLGQPTTQMEGKPLHRLGADQHERSRLMHAINQGLRSTRHLSRGHQFLLQGQLCTLDLHMSQVPGFSEGGQSEWLVSLVDQSEVVRQNAQQEQTLEELKLSLALNRDLASVTDAMPDMVAVCTADADVLWVNPALQRVLGWTLPELSGKGILDVLIGQETDEAGLALLQDIRMQWHNHDTAQRPRVMLRRRDGETCPVDLTLLSLRDASGQVVRRVLMGRDVSDAIRLEAEQEQVMRQRALHSVQTEFLSRMSHNMRTPLNAIMGFSQLLSMSLGNRLGSEDLQRLRIMQESGEQLLHMVDQALSLVQGDQLVRQTELKPVQLAPLVSDVLLLLAAKASARRVDVQSQVPDDAWVIGHGQLVHEVVVNLISNAIKYSHPGQAVEVRVMQVGASELALQVIDHGIGIDEADLPRLFQPFQRLDAGRAMASGHGLGLAISAQQVRWMSGRLEVSSQAGCGSIFSLVLPISLTAQHPALDASLPDVAQLFAALPAMVVLYVEDDEVNVAVMQHTLKLCPQLHLFTADSLAQGETMLKALSPDVVLLDINLQDGNGLDLCRARRASGEPGGPIFIALSADVTPWQIDQAKAAGVACFLAKPVDLLQLVRTLHKEVRPQGRTPAVPHSAA